MVSSEAQPLSEHAQQSICCCPPHPITYPHPTVTCTLPTPPRHIPPSHSHLHLAHPTPHPSPSGAGKPIVAEFSPVTDFREATCRQYEENNCSRGGYCNFMHVRPVSRDLRKQVSPSLMLGPAAPRCAAVAQQDIGVWRGTACTSMPQ